MQGIDGSGEGLVSVQGLLAEFLFHVVVGIKPQLGDHLAQHLARAQDAHLVDDTLRRVDASLLRHVRYRLTVGALLAVIPVLDQKTHRHLVGGLHIPEVE